MPDPPGPETARTGPSGPSAITQGSGAGQPVIELGSLRKTYGGTVALDSVSLEVPSASITCLVGPNGAGKTTAVECIEGLRTPDGGTVTVLGLSPVGDRQQLFERVGVQLQESSVQGRLTVGEIVSLFASLYRRPADTDLLLEGFGLVGKERERFENLSGGQKRRLNILLAVIGQPELVILDEPTSGLDPQARHNIWVLLKRYRSSGVTVLVTTHYLEEAEDHADQVAIIDRGRIVAVDDPVRLLASHRLGTRVWIPDADRADVPALRRRTEVSHLEELEGGVVVYGPDDAVRHAVGLVSGQEGTEVRRARLEDLFLLLTGRAYREG